MREITDLERHHAPQAGKPPRRRKAARAASGLLAACGVALAAGDAAASDAATAWRALCGPQPALGAAAEAPLAGAWLLDERIDALRGGARVSQRFATPNGELRIDRIDAGGALRRFIAEDWRADGDTLRAHLQIRAGADCALVAARRLIHDGATPVAMETLAADLTTVDRTDRFDAAVPRGVDPGGVRVALIDAGLAYDLPLFVDRLARGPDGAALGWDFWDDDSRPYDIDFAGGPFAPFRHGTAVASILAREAPNAALIPYRYPRPDMARLGDAVARAAAAGARVIAMPLGSRRAEDWTAFADALAQAPDLLAIVSAGNDGRDIDAEPLWPAALDLDRMIVVTSADGFGRLAQGSNWGARSVDLMVPAENQPVVDHRGARGSTSGSSYAVPRVAALAARLLAADPGLSADALKAAIYDRAVARDGVAIGWIPDPARD